MHCGPASALVLLLIVVAALNAAPASSHKVQRPAMPNWKEPKEKKDVKHRAYSLRPSNASEMQWVNEDAFEMLSPLDSLTKCFTVGPQVGMEPAGFGKSVEWMNERMIE